MRHAVQRLHVTFCLLAQIFDRAALRRIDLYHESDAVICDSHP